MPDGSLLSEVREFGAAETHRGWRLDHFLAVNLPQLSRSRLQALIAQGCVTLNGETIGDPNKRVKPADVVAITIPPPQPATTTTRAATAARPERYGRSAPVRSILGAAQRSIVSTAGSTSANR